MPEDSGHPSWDTILGHIAGGELNTALAANDWAIRNRVTGMEYMQRWVKYVIQGLRVPYLFLWGPQSSGKSILGDALEVLLGHDAVVFGNQIVCRKLGKFNSELMNARLVRFEECEFDRDTYYRVVAPLIHDDTIVIHKMGREPITIQNQLNFVHMHNHRNACPTLVGDEHLMALYVTMLGEGAEIVKPDLLDRLRGEKDSFLATLDRLPGDIVEGELALPPITTPGLIQAFEDNSG